MKIDVYCGANQSSSYTYIAPSLKPSSVKVIHLSGNTTVYTTAATRQLLNTHTAHCTTQNVLLNTHTVHHIWREHTEGFLHYRYIQLLGHAACTDDGAQYAGYCSCMLPESVVWNPWSQTEVAYTMSSVWRQAKAASNASNTMTSCLVTCIVRGSVYVCLARPAQFTLL